MEETINGKIEVWGDIKTGLKKDKSLWFSMSFKTTANSDWNKLWASSAEECVEYAEKWPVGKFVKFVRSKKSESDKYWNIDKSSIEITGDVIDDKPDKSETVSKEVKGCKEYVSPAFLGMVSNQAVQVAITRCKGDGLRCSIEAINIAFEELWDWNNMKKEEKGVM